MSPPFTMILRMDPDLLLSVNSPGSTMNDKERWVCPVWTAVWYQVLKTKDADSEFVRERISGRTPHSLAFRALKFFDNGNENGRTRTRGLGDVVGQQLYVRH